MRKTLVFLGCCLALALSGANSAWPADDAARPARPQTNTAQTQHQEVPGGAPVRAVDPRRASGKVAYLTFDDGPSPYTARVLSILLSHHATATFFQIGRQVPAFPKTEKAVRAQGSSIGNHTYDHADLTRLSDAAVRRELRGGPAPACVRPPYGAVNTRVRKIITGRGEKVVLWTADTRDWSRPGQQAILRDALLNLHNHSIILIHDGGGNRSETLIALPNLLDTLHSRGYRITGVPGC